MNFEQFGDRVDYFESLPREILLLILKYMDVPCIGSMIQTSSPKDDNIASLAAMERKWLEIVNRRFNLFRATRVAKGNVSRPKFYGGSTWKDAYRSMAISNRMPKMTVQYKKKKIFAKGCGFKIIDSKVANCHSLASRTISNTMGPNRQKSRNQFVACWVMIGHTEDCKLRVAHMDLNEPNFQDAFVGDRASNVSSGNQSDTYIELQLALQNTKSGFCKVTADIFQATIQMHDAIDSFFTQRIVRSGPFRPKVVYRSIGGRTGLKNGCTWLDEELGDKLFLRPFEFAIVSVNIPLRHYMELSNESIQFETDFLSRALSICVPVSCEEPIAVERRHDTCDNLSMTHSSVVVAKFMEEYEIWENYMALPGNCLVLVDKRD